MRGIRKYHNQFRCAWTDEKGEQKVRYFDTEQKAIDHYIKMTKAKKTVQGRQTKRANAVDKSLPVGLFHRKEEKSGHTYHHIGTTVVINEQQITRFRTYGNKRTKDEAINLVLNIRKQLLKKKAKEEGAQS